MDRASLLLERITTCTYEAARSKSREIEGFPDFTPLVAELQRLSGSDDAGQKLQNDFKVTTVQPPGSLVVKETFFAEFGQKAEFQDLITDHNSKYNTEGIRLSEPAPSPRKEPEKQHTVLVTTNEPPTAEKIASLPDASRPQFQHLLYSQQQCCYV